VIKPEKPYQSQTSAMPLNYLTPEELAAMRSDYKMQSFDDNDAGPDPLRLFERWFNEARQSGIKEPNAAALATVSAEGLPSSRIILIKAFDERGLTFYTNLGSRKAAELEANGQAALCFLWKELERQVRVEGVVERVSEEQAEAYFKSRPFDSKIGAWASRQSAIVTGGRQELEERFEALKKQYGNHDVPKPPFWGGYRVVPRAWEFWQGRTGRMHDRFRYELQNGNWHLSRLSP
jgi:pyridoxamine 5'-phosphate oxidase